jgi:hypothetical protein
MSIQKTSLLALMVAGSAFAADRTAIRLPDGCAFQAVDEGAPIPPASRCAQMLLTLNKAFATSALQIGRAHV